MIFQHYMELVTAQRWRIALVVLLIGGVSAALSYRQLNSDPEYTASASVLMIPTEAELAFSRSGGAGTREAARTLTETYIEYVHSRPVVEAAIRRVEEMKLAQETLEEAAPESVAEPEGFVIPERVTAFIEKAASLTDTFSRKLTELDRGSYVTRTEYEREISRVQNAITLDNVTETHIMRIQVTLSDPIEAAMMANALAEAYVELVATQIAADADVLESYLRDEINKQEATLAGLREERSQMLERFGGRIDEVGDGILDSMRIAETQLAELNARQLTVKMSRAAAVTQVRMIEPALPPPYPSSRGVLRTAAAGVFAALILSFSVVVIRDSLSDRIRTTTDLHRVVGLSGIGLMRRKWVSRRHKRRLIRLGTDLEQHFAAVGLPKPKQLPMPTETARLASPVIEGNFLVYEGGFAPQGSGRRVAVRAGDIKRAQPAQIDDCALGQFAQITGFMPMKELCLAAIGISAALANIGNRVYCQLPDGVIKKPPQFKFKHNGKLIYEHPRIWGEVVEDFMTIECVGPMNAHLDLEADVRTTPLICVLPPNKISEQIIEGMMKRSGAKGSNHLHFILMDV